MFISELEAERKKVLFTGCVDLAVSFLCWIFSAIYIACGYGKTSWAMVCLLVPFFVSGMTILLLGFTERYKALTIAVRCLWNFAMASFTVAMVLVGIFEIAGVPNSIFIVPICIGGALSAICSIVIFILNFRKSLEEI